MFRSWFNRYFSDPQIIILGVMLVVGFSTVFILGSMLMPVFIGIIIAYLLEGIVQRLQSFKVPRKAGILIVFILFITCFVIMVVGLFPLLSHQVVQFIQELPSMLSKGQKGLQELLEKYPELISRAQLDELMTSIASEIYNQVQQILSFSLASVKNVIVIIVYLVQIGRASCRERVFVCV